MTYGIVVELDTGALLFYGIPFIIVVGWFSSRLLGVHRGWGRSFVAGFFGWVFGVSIAAFIENESIRNTHQLNHVLLLALFFGVLISMFVGLILDVILKPRVVKHHRFRWLLHPIATAKRKLAPLGRSREILRYARKRGLTHYASASKLATPEFARRLRLTLEDCGGMFVKFGQIASTRTDLLPEVLTTELATLQSSARPVPADEIREVIERELGATVEEEFASFDFEPLAAASIGQTHRAVLKTGERVVVKVQRPGIEDIVHRDAAVLRLAAGVVDRRVEAARQLGVKRLAEELITSLERELDYGAEASSGVAFLGHLEGKEGIAAPIVYQSLSTRRVLVMEEIDGVTVADHGAVEAAPPSADVLATRLLESFLDQVLRDGLYHADPHPGNLLVRQPSTQGAAPAIVFLDFGATGTVSEQMRRGMMSFIQGAITRDSTRIVTAMKEMGFISRRADPEVFDRVVQYFHDKLRVQMSADGFSLKDLKFEPEKSLGSLLDLRDLNVSLADLRDAFHIPKEWILLERTLLLLLGVCTTLDPEMNPAAIIEPYLERFLLGEQKQWSEVVLDASREMALTALALPGELQRFITRALRGEIEIGIRNLDDSARVIYYAGQQLLWGGLGATAAVLATIFDGRGNRTAMWVSGIGAGLCGLLLVLSWFAGRPPKSRRRG
jgi:ubiquinone biosynthesis protein